MRKKLSVISAFLIFSMTLSGCSKSGKYSEDNYDVIASYIAHAVIKNDKNMAYKLVHMELPEEELQDTVADEATAPPQKEQPEDNNKSDNEEIPKEKETVKLASVLGLDGSFDIKYVKYEVKDDLGSSDYFSLSPDAGKKFGVVTFKVTNTSDTVKGIKMMPNGIKYILKYDGDEIRPLTTVLDDDIHYFDGELEAHKSKELILVFQITDGAKSIELSITSGAGTYNHTIQ